MDLANSNDDQTTINMGSNGYGDPPKDGTQADQHAYIKLDEGVRDELSNTGTILKLFDALYQEYVRNAFGKDFDMKMA